MSFDELSPEFSLEIAVAQAIQAEADTNSTTTSFSEPVENSQVNRNTVSFINFSHHTDQGSCYNQYIVITIEQKKKKKKKKKN